MSRWSAFEFEDDDEAVLKKDDGTRALSVDLFLCLLFLKYDAYDVIFVLLTCWMDNRVSDRIRDEKRVKSSERVCTTLF